MKNPAIFVSVLGIFISFWKEEPFLFFVFLLLLIASIIYNQDQKEKMTDSIAKAMATVFVNAKQLNKRLLPFFNLYGKILTEKFLHNDIYEAPEENEIRIFIFEKRPFSLDIADAWASFYVELTNKIYQSFFTLPQEKIQKNIREMNFFGRTDEVLLLKDMLQNPHYYRPAPEDVFACSGIVFILRICFEEEDAQPFTFTFHITPNINTPISKLAEAAQCTSKR